jgi:integrase
MRLKRLRQVLDWAIRRGLHPGPNPARFVRLAPENEPNPRPIPPTVFERLRAAADPRLEGYLVLGYYTGCRSGELWRLREGDLDLDAGTAVIGKRKTRKPLSIHLHPAVVAYLRPRLTGDPATPVLYPYRSPGYVSRAFNRLCRRLGVCGIRFHGLRHTLGIRLLRATKNLKLVQQALGHSSIVTTATFYARVLDDELREAMGRI